MMTRREMLTGAAAIAGAAALPRAASAQDPHAAHPSAKPKPADGNPEPPAWTRAPHAEPGEPGKHYTPTVTLNGSTMPWKLVDGVKVFHLIAEEVRNHEFAPGLKAHCWGYNGQVHGPTIEVVEGDEGFDKRAKKSVPGYMTMGEAGMGDMGDMGMKVPRNSLPMIGAKGPHDYITMGGMYTNIKIRDHLESYDKDPGWFEKPAGTLAETASPDELQRDLGFIPDATPAKGAGGHQHKPA